ncbi:cobalt-precorrin-6A reductase [Rhodoblastus sphagnicola]|uniref:Cobalt-precorrin-6A reductase n=1 Tax=Rhodoblastus sphagnicola TaxID=333368 RepID=A0A2S6N920_9HYPH|nr:cobalt-precorrin-6A reductase [Rhodoblastus sphagnicola]MBB4196869.1 precorrin-6A/cobalt-precorrin-6A reductase [Rhodoblastus sphagnicola]PPQ31091.1 cobalt-precorrin-6A reductase [Rhodoblastus sphagnicola]
MRILVLGGSSEASLLARALSDRADVAATLSLAGRTKTPAALPLPTRVGGFGGVEGLVAYLKAEGVEAVIDATHPFAAQMKRHAAEACAATGVPLCAFTRAPWVAGEGDNWIEVDDAAAAARALGDAPKRVFLTTGRLQAGAFAGPSPHHFVLRSIDAPDAAALPGSIDLVLARGPFTVADEIALMREKRIDIVVSKNAGGAATGAKISAARELGLPVVMIRRPQAPERPVFVKIEDALGWIEAHRSAS